MSAGPRAVSPSSSDPSYDIPELLAARAADTDVLLVLCDFDGCLAELAAAPELVEPDTKALYALDSLAASPRSYVGVVSGRSLADLRSVCPVRAPVMLIGSHGAESDSGLPALSTVDVVDVVVAAGRASLIAELTPLVAALPGARLEIKPASVAVHVRQAQPQPGSQLLTNVLQLAQGRGLRVMPGKAVLELMLSAATKGDAVAALAAKTGATGVVYIGDDVTDEDAFAVLGMADVTVKVGIEPSVARYRLPGVSAVSEFLVCLATARSPSPISPGY